MPIVSLRAAMLPRGHSQPSSCNPALQELFIQVFADLTALASCVFGPCW